MQRKKKQMLLVAVGVIAVLFAAALVYAGIRGSTGLELTVGGHKIGAEEYLQCVKAVEYDTKVQLQQKYDAEYGEDFWKGKYGEQYGYEILAENAVERLKYIHAVYDIAEEKGDLEDGSYDAAVERWKAENDSRKEKVASGEVVYGLKEYSFDQYQQYEISILKETFCTDTEREEMKLTEEEIREHYNSRDWIFGEEEEKADLETARIAVERELREQKYDEIIMQKAVDSQVEGDMNAVSRFTLKNI